jgi:hypothetical protein
LPAGAGGQASVHGYSAGAAGGGEIKKPCDIFTSQGPTLHKFRDSNTSSFCEIFTVGFDSFEFVQRFGSQITFTAMGARYNRNVFDHE